MLQPAALLIATLFWPVPLQQDEAWRALTLPALCDLPVATARLPLLEYGRHLVSDGEDLAQRSPSAAAFLPVPMLFGLLSDEVARRGLRVEFQPTAPPLLARGTAGDLDALEALLADLDAAGRSLEIGVEAWLTAGATQTGAYPSPSELAAAVASSPPWALARARSGAAVVLGARETRSFVHGYSIELAADSGVADPVLGSAIVGTTLHLTATRSGGGRRVHVEGFLDLSELLSIESFDTRTFDLGVVQQPRLGVVQIAFSGSVPSTGALAVSFAGAPLGIADQTLWLRLSCGADPSPDAGSDADSGPNASTGWRGLDVALLERRHITLPLPHPGAGLAGVELPALPAVLAEPLPASALAQVLSRGASRGGSGRPFWAPGLLLAPAADPGWDEVESLVTAAEAARGSGGTLTLTRGALRVQLPLAERVPARLLIGVETTLLSEYDVEVATEVWLPEPVVEPIFDGLLVQGALEGNRFRGATWTAHSDVGVILEPEQVGLGRLQLSRRAFAAAPCDLAAGAGAGTLLEPAAPLQPQLGTPTALEGRLDMQ